MNTTHTLYPLINHKIKLHVLHCRLLLLLLFYYSKPVKRFLSIILKQILVYYAILQLHKNRYHLTLIFNKINDTVSGKVRKSSNRESDWTKVK